MIEKLSLMLNMTVEQLKKEIDNQSFANEELIAFNKGKDMIDEFYKLNSNDSYAKVAISLMAYTLYKEKGGK
jgi:butyrate kinase